jgi:hypothetical protein
MNDFREITPGGRPFTRMYLNVMLWFVGRAVQAAARQDLEVKREFEALPHRFTFALTAAPDGPSMVVGKDETGRVKYLGRRPGDHPLHVRLTLKSMEALFLLFTFRESTATATARDRLYVEGGLPEACAVVRILDIVQVYLLPKPVAKLAIKRYPRWRLKRHTWDRAMVTLRAVIGY